MAKLPSGTTMNVPGASSKVRLNEYCQRVGKEVHAAFKVHTV
jgi:hypothetical protein